MKKKIIAIILALCMTLSLAACGESGVGNKNGVAAGSNKSASGSAKTDVYVDLWGVWAADNDRAKYLQEKANEFAAQYKQETGISVTLEYVAQSGYDGVAEKLAAGSVTNELPVMSMMEESQLFQFYPICTDMSQLIAEEDVDNYLDGLLTSCYMNNTLYAVPAGRSYMMICANADLLKAAGYTTDEVKTWDDVKSIAADVAALGDDKYGYAVFWDTDCWCWEGPLYSNGGSVVSEDGKKVTFADDDVGAIYMEMVQKMLQDGTAWTPYGNTSGDSYDAMIDMFLNGKIGIIPISCTGFGYINSAMTSGKYTPFNFSFLKQPAGKGGNSTVSGGSNFIICNKATSTQKEVAAAYLKYIASDENQAEWNKISGYLGVTDSVYKSKFFADSMKDPNLVAIADGTQYTHARPYTQHWREMYTYMVDYLNDFAKNPDKYDPKELNQNMAKYCQSIIDKD